MFDENFLRWNSLVNFPYYIIKFEKCLFTIGWSKQSCTTLHHSNSNNFDFCEKPA